MMGDSEHDVLGADNDWPSFEEKASYILDTTVALAQHNGQGDHPHGGTTGEEGEEELITIGTGVDCPSQRGEL